MSNTKITHLYSLFINAKLGGNCAISTPVWNSLHSVPHVRHSVRSSIVQVPLFLSTNSCGDKKIVKDVCIMKKLVC